MPIFSKTSLNRLHTCELTLQTLFKEIVKNYDCIILCGYRSAVDQNKAYYTGKSKLKFPESKHNIYPSFAVDVAPYFTTEPHIRWKDTGAFYMFAGYVKATAERMCIPIIYGGDWNSNGTTMDQSFNDLVHFELKLY